MNMRYENENLGTTMMIWAHLGFGRLDPICLYEIDLRLLYDMLRVTVGVCKSGSLD